MRKRTPSGSQENSHKGTSLAITHHTENDLKFTYLHCGAFVAFHKKRIVGLTSLTVWLF